MTAPPARDNVSSTVIRALALLDVLVAEPRGLALRQAAERAQLDKATAYRLLGSLQKAGLIVRDPANGLYLPGLKLVRMASMCSSRSTSMRWRSGRPKNWR